MPDLCAVPECRNRRGPCPEDPGAALTGAAGKLRVTSGLTGRFGGCGPVECGPDVRSGSDAAGRGTARYFMPASP